MDPLGESWQWSIEKKGYGYLASQCRSSAGYLSNKIISNVRLVHEIQLSFHSYFPPANVRLTPSSNPPPPHWALNDCQHIVSMDTLACSVTAIVGRKR